MEKANVIIPANHPNPPEEHEVEAAWIVAKHYSCTVEFLMPTDDFKRKTPDTLIMHTFTEFKSPTGKSKKNTVRKQFERASLQGCSWLVFDGRRTRFTDEFLCKEIRRELKHRRRIKKVIFITKQKLVIELVR